MPKVEAAPPKARARVKLKLESGYVPPPRRSYDFETFQRGQSVSIETKADMMRIRNAAYAWARRMNKKYEKDPKFSPIEFRCCLMEKGGWRLFRTE